MDMQTELLDAIATLNDQIRNVAHSGRSDVGPTIATLEAAKKVILARLGPRTSTRS